VSVPSSRSVLVTGASSGFGARIVEAFAQSGWQVIASARDPARIPTNHAKVLPVRLDVADEDQRLAVIDLIRERFDRRLDCLVNNAGYGLVGPLEELPETEIRRQMETNFFGAVMLTRDLLPALRQARGRVIAISSMAAYTAFPLHGLYCASKRALEGVFEALSYEARDLGVQSTIVEPGGFRTNFARNMIIVGNRASGPYAKQLRGFQDLRERLLRRPGANPERVAAAVLDLAERQRMPLRRRVGSDAWALYALTTWLPQPIAVRVLRHMFGRAFTAGNEKSP